jgi:sarcosine oxidase
VTPRQDLVIIGGGVMGLFTAYYASRYRPAITVLERATIGDPNTASYGLTRSIRNDYLDPFYARLAHEARGLWLDVQREADATVDDQGPLIIECGCLNLAKHSITPDLPQTYAEQTSEVLRGLGLRLESFDREAMAERFPQFDVDLGRLDVEAGFVYLPAVTATLREALRRNGVKVRERVRVEGIAEGEDGVRVETDGLTVEASAAVITAGLGVNELLQQVEGCHLQFPLRPDRPVQAKYFMPPAARQPDFTPDRLPVFAYLDVGIYGHPWYLGKTMGVKIGFYNPPDYRPVSSSITDVHSFVRECMPSLNDAEAVDVTDVDQCSYDLVADDNFILGPLPGTRRIVVGVGWRGTGYKFAPWVGRTLAQLAVQGGTVYDIARFNPERFA